MDRGASRPWGRKQSETAEQQRHPEPRIRLNQSLLRPNHCLLLCDVTGESLRGRLGDDPLNSEFSWLSELCLSFRVQFYCWVCSLLLSYWGSSRVLGRLLRRQAWELGGVLCCNARKSPSMDTFRLLLSVGWTSWAPESWVQPVSWLLGGVNGQRTCRQRQAPPAASKAMSEPGARLWIASAHLSFRLLLFSWSQPPGSPRLVDRQWKWKFTWFSAVGHAVFVSGPPPPPHLPGFPWVTPSLSVNASEPHFAGPSEESIFPAAFLASASCAQGLGFLFSRNPLITRIWWWRPL